VELKKNVGLEKQWIFNDGSVPIQLRVISAVDIRREEHLHKTMHEYFYVLQGDMKISINGNAMEMGKDDLVIVEPGERHYIIENSPDLQLLLLMPPPVPDDKVILSSPHTVSK
jgi:quercetin dioxygenase-like cupin family protein